MSQKEAVVKVMEQNGGFATLDYLYQEALKVPGVNWGTRTPFASIRRIVQMDKEIFCKVKPGLWALRTHENKLPFGVLPLETASTEEKEIYDHSFYQGLLVKIGNMRKQETFVPVQDRNKLYLGKQRLGEISSKAEFHKFCYERFLKYARTVDVCWFNDRKMPTAFFEIEHTSGMVISLAKFTELQDFRAGLVIVANNSRKIEFEEKIKMDAFRSIKNRVDFIGYDEVTELYDKEDPFRKVENKIPVFE